MTQHPTSEERRPANRGPKAAAGNRAALVTAAREIYAVHGLDVPLSRIARRAGVGQGVLYRHFPDREAIAAAVLEENVRQIEQAAAAEGATPAGVLGVLTWHLTQSAAFIGLLHADGASGRLPAHAFARELSERVERALRGCLPEGHRLGAPDAPDDLMLAVAMVSGAVTGPTHRERAHRALAAWRLLGVTVGPVRPFEG
ncbi:TetR/AcrR family transcriptional regulator [Streptomyces viridosporus]|uniref:TetR-family transcriptional regulator n=1 Tax=Streptomyces viridosporus (strain ATCC 14672 / DSM 40746 / JCM 4963 / KCTC 9882 / NRRL B-12104 / FH 1290) TaxID=566461 RepID=D5ZY55_STRV1|nr:TetR/AcrR family transcriptional regulator [Streptomyces viridosporus]EFE71053.1 tetR-family transcriptional regulator [Streptomyces viridosporus ATCC 14672]